MKTQWIVGLVVGALALGFVGGIVGPLVFPARAGSGTSGEDMRRLTDRVARVETGQRDLETRISGITASGGGLRIGVVDVESLFTRVFVPQVQAERAAMEARVRESQALQADYAAGRLRLDVYQQRYLQKQTEVIQASLKVNLTMLDKMIASPGFLNLRADLENLRTQAQPLEAQVQAVVREAQVAIVDMQAFSQRLQGIQATFEQLDQVLTQIAAMKILELSQQVAREQGYDIVLRTKDVVMFRREATVVDLSSDVEGRLWRLFPR
jgi:Skp family chaperone for outer membrane proteins